MKDVQATGAVFSPQKRKTSTFLRIRIRNTACSYSSLQQWKPDSVWNGFRYLPWSVITWWLQNFFTFTPWEGNKKCKEIPTVGRKFRTISQGSVVDPDSDERIHRFLVPRIRIRPYLVRNQFRILPPTSKTVRKNLISTILWLLFDFLSKKTEVNVPSKISNQKKLWKNSLFFLLASGQPMTKKSGAGSGSESGSARQWYGSADPDLCQHNTDP